jgi:iron complex outermembrane recepter protein
MKPNPKISAAVAAILSVPSSALVLAQQAETAPAAATGGELAEVVVTAERRTENIQDVPITVQAITGAQLTQLNVTNFNDLLKYTPNVTYSGNGPGTGNIFMRGLGGIGSGNQSQSTTAAFPNVALYLDDQSMQFPARNNDPYLVDMERVEVLEGPQGTLFGGGAQAGAIRYITNKPNLSATSGSFTAGYGYTSGGNPNSQLNAILNVPLIPDVLAVRAVAFNEHQGGYISNVPSTISYAPGSNAALFGGNPVANNANLLESDANTVDYQGARVSVLWKVNDDWNLLLQQNYQDMESNGWFYAYPQDSNGNNLQPYQIAAFTPAYNKDRYESTAWTLNGKISDLLSMVYTGSYMVRHIQGQQDYSNYERSSTGSFYGCIGEGAGYFNQSNFPGLYPKGLSNKPLTCYAPVGQWVDTVDNEHQSHELRVSTNPDYFINGLAGAYWEKFVIDDQMNFNYLDIPQCGSAQLAGALAGGPACLSAVGPVPGTWSNEASPIIDQNTAFGENAQRGYKQTAFFASVNVDLIPKTLTVSGGTRWYRYDEFEEGSEFYSESTSSGYVLNHANGVCLQKGLCGFPMDLSKHETGTRSRLNLTWHITQDVMTYYTFSQGFRPGGFNRTDSSNGQVFLHGEVPYCTYSGTVKTCIPDSDQYEKPAGYNSDNLINNEIGFKSEFFEHRLLFNASAYYMKWENEQLSLFEPTVLGNTTFNVNGPNFIIKGFEVQFVARVTDGLTVQGSSSVNSSSQSSSPCLESVGVDPANPKTKNNPTPAGQCVIVNSPSGPLPNALGAFGTSPAFSPPWMFNLRARYDWEMNSYKPFAWVGASHIGPMSNEPKNYFSGTNPTYANPNGTGPVTTLLLYEIPSYTTYDGAIGVAKDNWTAQVTGSNLTNAYGPTNISSGQFIKSEVPLRPRVVMFLVSYAF